MRFSDMEGGYVGLGNLNVSPLFVAPASMNYQLPSISPSRDTEVVRGVIEDILGVVRPVGSAPGMGAYESVPEPIVVTLGAGVWVLYSRCGKCGEKRKLFETVGRR
ncbi:MAG: hypothetical protein N2595_02650 [bacterium]|nr:hypothetical protein [bacterium]